jgi:hypothetical protein
MSGRPQPPEHGPTGRGRSNRGPAGKAKGPAGKAKGPDGPSPLTLIGSGFEFAGVVTLLTLGGWWLDGKFATRPWLMLLGLLVGTIGGIYRLYLEGKRSFRD